MEKTPAKLGTRLLRTAAVVAFAAGLVMTGLPGDWSVGPNGAAQAQEADLTAQGHAAISAYMGALVSQDRAAIEAIIAPEFQAMRSEGGGYDRASYLETGLPTIAAMPEIVDLVVTASDGLLVTRYTLLADETTDGAVRTTAGPRLTVFRKDGDVWLVVAHANFSRIAQ